MKNSLRSLLLIAVAATAFVNCAKDPAHEALTPDKNGFRLNIAAQDKVVIDASNVRTEYDPEIKNIRWSGTEEMQLYVNTVRYVSKISTLTTPYSFPADIRSISVPGSITLQGVIPSTAVLEVSATDDATQTILRLKMELIPVQDGGTISSFDPAADILVSQNLPVELTQEDITAQSKSIDNFRFGRPMAVSKYTFNVTNPALSADELVESVQLSITPSAGKTKKYLTGRFYYAPNTAQVVDGNGNPIKGSTPFYSGQGSDYVKTTYTVQPKLSELAFWPVTAPVTLEAGDALVFTIGTDQNTIVKTITLAQPMTYSNRQLNTAAVSINETNCVVTPKQTPPTGKVAILQTSEIASAGTGTGYKTFTINSLSGTWTGTALVNAAYLQINTPSTGTRKSCSITSPEFNGSISNIKINTTNSTAKDRILYILPADYDATGALETAIDTSKAIAQATVVSTNASVSIPINSEISQFKLFTNGAAYISSIEVTYTEDLTPKVIVPSDKLTFSLAYSDKTAHSFTYSVRNAQLSDVIVSQDTASESWLLVDNSTPGTVEFFAEVNTGAARTATITLTLANGNSIPVTVTQAAVAVQLAAPAELNTTVDGAKVSASWTVVANASNYAWRIATGGSDALNGMTTNTSVDITGLSASTTYTLYVKAVGDGVAYLTSTESQTEVTTAAIPQLEMSELTIDAGATTAASLTAQWTAVTNATGYKYKVTKTSDSSTVVAETAISELSIALTGLAASTEYTISVMAIGDGTNYVDSAYKTVNGTTAAGPAASWHTETWSPLNQSASTYGSGSIAGNLGAWSYAGCSGNDMAQFTMKKGLSMGQTSDKSVITSPTFSQGISGIKFNYYVNNVARTIVVTIYENGAQVDKQTITPTAASTLQPAEITVSTTGTTHFTFTPGHSSRRASVGDIEVMY